MIALLRGPVAEIDLTDRKLLIGGSVAALVLTTALAVLFLFIPLINPETRTTWAEAGMLFGMVSVGIASAGITLQSARHNGRWGWVGFVLAILYLVLPWLTPYAIGVGHWIAIPAAFVFALALANTFSRRPQE